MSHMHAETDRWLLALRARADKVEASLGEAGPESEERRAAQERLKSLRAELDETGERRDLGDDRRSHLERLADDLEQALYKALVRH